MSSCASTQVTTSLVARLEDETSHLFVRAAHFAPPASYLEACFENPLLQALSSVSLELSYRCNAAAAVRDRQLARS